jgi:peptidoglycan/xylan/chitin deacetylase (PgdA/CDA1 family)
VVMRRYGDRRGGGAPAPDEHGGSAAPAGPGGGPDGAADAGPDAGPDGGAGGGAGARDGRRVSRRMLIAGGGLAFGAVAVGWGVGGMVTDALDSGPGAAARRGTGEAGRTASAARTGNGGGAGEAGHPRKTTSHPSEITARSGRGGSHHRGAATKGRVPDDTVYYVHDGPKVIALTIDDGPSPVYTPQILRLLARYRVTASFSMIGLNARYHPGIARDVADAGHMIVNHTWDHANLTRLSRSAVRTEIARAMDAIEAAAGARPGMFRAPYGAWSPAILEYCVSAGLTPLDWSVDPRDWSRPGVSSIIRNIMRNTRTGSIILEHDGGGDRSQTVAALSIVIPRLLDEGYRFQHP